MTTIEMTELGTVVGGNVKLINGKQYREVPVLSGGSAWVREDPHYPPREPGMEQMTPGEIGLYKYSKKYPYEAAGMR